MGLSHVSSIRPVGLTTLCMGSEPVNKGIEYQNPKLLPYLLLLLPPVRRLRLRQPHYPAGSSRCCSPASPACRRSTQGRHIWYQSQTPSSFLPAFDPSLTYPRHRQRRSGATAEQSPTTSQIQFTELTTFTSTTPAPTIPFTTCPGACANSPPPTQASSTYPHLSDGECGREARPPHL
jgi:hypothetical protein